LIATHRTIDKYMQFTPEVIIYFYSTLIFELFIDLIKLLSDRLRQI